MKIKKIKTYKFHELSSRAKGKAIDNYYDSEDYEWLRYDLRETLEEQLKENGIKLLNEKPLKILYSWQGEELCFIGDFTFQNLEIEITHNARYYYADSTDIQYYNINSGNYVYEEDETVAQDFKRIYLDICGSLEDMAHEILTYRMSDNEFEEYCDSNNCTFLEDGTREYETIKHKNRGEFMELTEISEDIFEVLEKLEYESINKQEAIEILCGYSTIDLINFMIEFHNKVKYK